MIEFSGIDTKKIDFVRDYIHKTRRFEWVVNYEKAKINLPKTQMSVGHILASRINQFRNAKGFTEQREAAEYAEYWINYALDNGVIDEGSGLTGKLTDCRSDLTVKENELAEISPQFTQIKAERDHLVEENNKLKTENERLKMQIDKK